MPRRCDNQKCHLTLPSVPEKGENSPPAESHYCRFNKGGFSAEPAREKRLNIDVAEDY